MKNLKRYCAFWIPYLVFICLLGGLIIWNEKADLHLWLNNFHTPFLDFVFKYYTHVGGWAALIVIAGLLFYRYQAALLVFLAQLFSFLTTGIFKCIFNAPRPTNFFNEHFPGIDLPYVLGVSLNPLHSFPSGHTTSAFALFLSLAFLTKRKGIHFLYCLLAVLVGYSRIYLSQHFAADVLAGSIIGVIMTIVASYIVDKKQPEWYEKSLLKK